MSAIVLKHWESLSPKARRITPYFALALAVLLSYGNTFGNAFLFDDDLIISMNTFLRDWTHVGDILTKSTTSGIHIAGGFYRPMQILLYLFMYQLGGGKPLTFHLLNLSLHIANTCFVYALGTRKLNFNKTGTFLATLIWGVHAIHTEAITYMSGTADPLAMFFCLWALILLLPDLSSKKILKVFPLFLLAIVSKESAVMFPALVCVFLFYFDKERLKPKTYLRTVPLWIVALAFSYWRTHAEGFDGPQNYGRFFAMSPYAEFRMYAEHFSYRFYTFLATLPEYLRLLLWPTHLHLERSFPIVTSFWKPLPLIGFFMLVLAAVHIVFSFRTGRGKALSFGLLWFGTAHAPDSGILVAMNAIFLEHWMYFPSAGLFLGVAQTLVELLRNGPPVLKKVCAAVALTSAFALSVATHLQNKIWHEPIAFYNNIIDNHELSARVFNNLALCYSKEAKFDKAIENFERGIQLADIYAETRFNLALVYINNPAVPDRVQKAIANLERSIEIQPNFFRSYKALGDIYHIFLHDPAKAETYYKQGRAMYEKQVGSIGTLK